MSGRAALGSTLFGEVPLERRGPPNWNKEGDKACNRRGQVTPSAYTTPARFTTAPCSIRRATVSRTVTVPAEDAYGQHRDDLTLKVGRE